MARGVKRSGGRRWFVLASVWALTGSFPAAGMLSTTIRFEGPPSIVSHHQIGVSGYSEAGLLFTTLAANPEQSPFTLVRNGGGVPGYPTMDGAYLQVGLGGSLRVSGEVEGTLFTPHQVDFAEYSHLLNFAQTLVFTGYLAGGSTVTAHFPLDGWVGAPGTPDFQTFLFPESFMNLVRLETTASGFSMDNLSVTIVPEPSVALLLGWGGLMVVWVIRARRTSI